MEYRQLGKSGLRVSSLILGTDNYANPTTQDEAARIIEAALDAGLNTIDCADSYGVPKGEAERMIGEILKANGRREETVIATKFYLPTSDRPNDRGGSRHHIMRACEASLRRLQTDHIDLYQMHRPDFDVPLEETLRALDDLVAQGKVNYIGSSTAPAWRVVESLLTSEIKGFAAFVSEQSPYNLLDRRIENEVLPMARYMGLGVITWSPLAMGMLAGRYASAAGAPADSRSVLRGGIYHERVTEAAVAVGNRFAALAREHGFAPAHLALLWVMAQSGVTAPIIGPRNLEQLTHLLPVMEMELSEEVRAACDALVPPGGHVANFFNSTSWAIQPPGEGNAYAAMIGNVRKP